ncbi:hypothetical protein MFRU_048g00300 [Monilinia fructicola]|nr:hypothetical protein MFRU_048g00300 [Monilinia fructicola]
MRSLLAFSYFLVLLAPTGILALKVPINRNWFPTIAATSVHNNFRRDPEYATTMCVDQDCGFDDYDHNDLNITKPVILHASSTVVATLSSASQVSLSEEKL